VVPLSGVLLLFSVFPNCLLSSATSVIAALRRFAPRRSFSANSDNRYQLAIKSFAVPGESGWSLGGMYPPPASRDETETFKAYLKQARTECSERLLDRFYNEDGTQNKWWMSFSKRKFMGKELKA